MYKYYHTSNTMSSILSRVMKKNKILEYRTKLGLTQRQLAAMVNITYQSLQRYENGTILPSVIIAIDIAKALKTTVEELYDVAE